MSVVLLLAAAGCGDDRAPAPLAIATRPNACVAAPRDLAAPGPYAVRRVTARVTRQSAVAHGPRRIDPTVWYPSGRAPPGCRLPLILFSHGHNGSPASCAALCAHVATHGFVVLAPTHPDRRTRRTAQGPESTIP